MAIKRPQQTTKQVRKGRTELTEEQKQEIKEAFDLFDTDGSGNKSNANILIILLYNRKNRC